MSIRWALCGRRRSEAAQPDRGRVEPTTGEIRGNIIWHPEAPASRGGKKRKQRERERAKGSLVRKAA